MNRRAYIKEKEQSLEDLLQIRETESYNEYVTAENIINWIRGQRLEITRLKQAYREELWAKLQQAHLLSESDRTELKKEYDRIVDELKRR